MGVANEACVGDKLVGEEYGYEVEYQRDGWSRGT